jgi:hypothetical protein
MRLKLSPEGLPETEAQKRLSEQQKAENIQQGWHALLG